MSQIRLAISSRTAIFAGILIGRLDDSQSRLAIMGQIRRNGRRDGTVRSADSNRVMPTRSRQPLSPPGRTGGGVSFTRRQDAAAFAGSSEFHRRGCSCLPAVFVGVSPVPVGACMVVRAGRGVLRFVNNEH
jgi:hypothetical protein